MRSAANLWRRSRFYDVLRMGGYVAFNLPRVVSSLAAMFLSGIAGTLIYVLAADKPLPLYFSITCAVLIAGCLLTVGALWLGAYPIVAQRGWIAGSLVSTVVMVLYLATRMVTLPGLASVTGRWDVAAGTLVLAFAAGFVAVHVSILVGINVAYPHRRDWHD